METAAAKRGAKKEPAPSKELLTQRPTTIKTTNDDLSYYSFFYSLLFQKLLTLSLKTY